MRKKAVTAFLVLVGCLLGYWNGETISSNLIRAIERMMRAIAPSPSGEWAAFRSEYWRGGERERSITVINLHNGIEYSMTPRYMEVVESSDPGLIAFLTKDCSTDRYTVRLYYTDAEEREKRVKPHPDPIARLDPLGVRKDLQFSTGGSFLRYAFKYHGLFSKSRNRYRTVPEGDWRAEWTEADFVGVEWLPPKTPSRLPDFMTARQPAVHENTAPVWSPDEKTVYVHDEEGIWKANLLLPRMQKWELALPVKNIRRFELSPDGRYALAEVASKDGASDSQVMIFSLEGKAPLDSQAELAVQGRLPAFNSDGRLAAFIADGNLYVIDKGGSSNLLGGGESISLNTDVSPVWAPDSQSVYVLGEAGVWQAHMDAPMSDVWSLVYPADDLLTLQVSSDGRYMLVESPEKEEPGEDAPGAPEPGYLREITLIDLEDEQRIPQHVGQGWSTVFSADGQHFFYAHFTGTVMVRAADGKVREIYGIAMQPIGLGG